jgi:hypothetical protein
VAISAVTPRDMLVASSNMADTIYPSSFYETGCSGSLLSMVEGRALMGAEVLRYD